MLTYKLILLIKLMSSLWSCSVSFNCCKSESVSCRYKVMLSDYNDRKNPEPLYQTTLKNGSFPFTSNVNGLH